MLHLFESAVILCIFMDLQPRIILPLYVCTHIFINAKYLLTTNDLSALLGSFMLVEFRNHLEAQAEN
jgi:hypothetical protein